MALRQTVLPPPTSTTNQGLTTTTPYSTAVKRDMKSHEFYRRKKLEFFNNAFVSAFRLMSLPFHRLYGMLSALRFLQKGQEKEVYANHQHEQKKLLLCVSIDDPENV
jgi:hypothetical protein